MWPASDGWGGGPLSLVDDSSVVRGGEGLTDSCRQGNQVAPTGTGWCDLLPGGRENACCLFFWGLFF